MCYVEVKQFELVKGTGRAFADKFFETTVVRGVEGFKDLKVGLNDASSKVDIVIITMIWESEEALLTFKRGNIHKELHRNRKPNPNLVKHSSTRYEIVHEL